MNDLMRWGRNPWSLFDEMESLQRDVNQLFNNGYRGRTFRRHAYPPLNVWSSEEGIVIDAEIPGAEASDVDINVLGDELTVQGRIEPAEPAEGAAYHRRERSSGEFSRTVRLPFRADPSGVEAAYKNGILRIKVPRSEEEKPRKIKVQSA